MQIPKFPQPIPPEVIALVRRDEKETAAEFLFSSGCEVGRRITADMRQDDIRYAWKPEIIEHSGQIFAEQIEDCREDDISDFAIAYHQNKADAKLASALDHWRDFSLVNTYFGPGTHYIDEERNIYHEVC